jgi:hypothetical protein
MVIPPRRSGPGGPGAAAARRTRRGHTIRLKLGDSDDVPDPSPAFRDRPGHQPTGLVTGAVPVSGPGRPRPAAAGSESESLRHHLKTRSSH